MKRPLFLTATFLSIGSLKAQLIPQMPQPFHIYGIVFFEPSSREILAVYRRTGNGRGRGLRNYWANSIQRCLDSLEPFR